MSNPVPVIPDDELSSDILRGASQIAAFLLGSADEERKIYHLAESGSLPHFRLGRIVCARRSVLMSWIKEQETKGRRSRRAA